MHISRSVLTTLLLITLTMVAAPAVSPAAIVLSIGIAPPLLPVYVQPPCPGPDYMWTPGYWAYDDGYFWVPGTWVLVPEPGFYWTPGYWGWNGGLFVFNEGYWGPQVGFYGGINYGFGYTGAGYQGGYWNHGTFFYNRAVTNVGSVGNVYSRAVTMRNANRVSFNGGAGGITARPTATEMAAAHDRHIGPTGAQTAHVRAASGNRQLYASVNHGRPPVAATAKPGQFGGRGAAPASRAAANRPAVAHPNRAAQAHRTVKPQATRQAQIRPQPRHPANVRPQATRQAHVRPTPNNVHSQPRTAHARPAPNHVHSQPRMAQVRPAPSHVHSQPRMAQVRPPAARGPVQQRPLARTQPMAHAAPRPQPREAPAPHNAQPQRKKS